MQKTESQRVTVEISTVQTTELPTNAWENLSALERNGKTTTNAEV
jgi:hypothetical protein